MDREFSNCGVDQLVNELFNIDDELPVSYYQWRTPADGSNTKARKIQSFRLKPGISLSPV